MSVVAYGSVALLTLFPAACAGPGPKLFPAAPLETRRIDGGNTERLYDTDADGQPDYAERLGPDGVMQQLRFGLDDDAGLATVVDWPARLGPISVESADDDAVPHLLIILDSIPFAMVRDLWQQGRFRLFDPPARIISPFPVMTDPCLAEFFGVSPCPGVESEYYDGTRLTSGFGTYLAERNAPWLACVDYHLSPYAHGQVYSKPHRWFDHDLGRIQRLFTGNPGQNFSAYVVSTSALGARFGRNGHQAALVRLDRFCQQITHTFGGRVGITLLSDHGHNLVTSRRIPLERILTRFGYRVGESLRAPGDVVLPGFGVVTCAAIHTQQPAAVAGDLVGVEGIALTLYRDGLDIVVLSRQGRASLSKKENRLRYDPLRGDPLELTAIWAGLGDKGLVDADGFVRDRDLFDATVGHSYPDAIARVWRAFDGLFENTPDVYVSVEDGYHCGSPFMTHWLDLAAAHGNLGTASSCGFAMTTAGKLDPVMRMQDLRTALQALGVPIR
ncbi:MAG: hypothetical protein ACE5GE_13175, partial [Phycisphaerae bacterium]